MLVVVLAAAAAALLRRLRRTVPINQCVHCGYRIDGLRELTCPECGKRSI
jgi:predicted RNA-binding Zn-ribbon protein involved in translation (DUF1610 family)